MMKIEKYDEVVYNYWGETVTIIEYNKNTGEYTFAVPPEMRKKHDWHQTFAMGYENSFSEVSMKKYTLLEIRDAFPVTDINWVGMRRELLSKLEKSK